MSKTDFQVIGLPSETILQRRDRPILESRPRSLIKALSWRVTALVVTMSIVLVVTGELRFAAIVGGMDALFKIGLYYFHERAWNRFSFGRGGP